MCNLQPVALSVLSKFIFMCITVLHWSFFYIRFKFLFGKKGLRRVLRRSWDLGPLCSDLPLAVVKATNILNFFSLFPPVPTPNQKSGCRSLRSTGGLYESWGGASEKEMTPSLSDSIGNLEAFLLDHIAKHYSSWLITEYEGLKTKEKNWILKRFTVVFSKQQAQVCTELGPLLIASVGSR